MSRRRISTRKSMLNINSSDVPATDEGGFDALQNSIFVLPPSSGLDSTNRISFRETDNSQSLSLPTNWISRIQNSSIGLADNNKENDMSLRNRDLDNEDLPLFNKKDLKRQRRLQAYYATSSSSETENDFKKIISGQIKTSQQVHNQKDVDDANSSEQLSGVESDKDIELIKKSVPRRKMFSHLSTSSFNETDNDFEKILSGKIKISQQEIRQNVQVGESHDSSPSDAQNSSSILDKLVSVVEKKSSWEAEHIDEAPVTLKESTIDQKRNSLTASKMERHLARDNQEDSGSSASKGKVNSHSNAEDVSIHTSDQSSRSDTLKNISSKRTTNALLQTNENVQSYDKTDESSSESLVKLNDFKETSSISVHDSDRDISSMSGSTNGSSKGSQRKIATDKQISQEQVNISLLKRSNSRSSAQMESRLKESRCETNEQINFDEQDSHQSDVFDADTELESLQFKIKSKWKSDLEIADNATILNNTLEEKSIKNKLRSSSNKESDISTESIDKEQSISGINGESAAVNKSQMLTRKQVKSVSDRFICTEDEESKRSKSEKETVAKSSNVLSSSTSSKAKIAQSNETFKEKSRRTLTTNLAKTKKSSSSFEKKEDENHNDSGNEDADQRRRVSIVSRVSEAKNARESSEHKLDQSRKRRISDHENDEEEINISVSVQAKKSKKDVPFPTKKIVFSRLTPESHQQNQSNALKRTTRMKIPYKPIIQSTMDGYLKIVKKSVPSKLSLKYKSLQDFDNQHGQSKLSQDVAEIRMKLINDFYIVQETKRITFETIDAEEKESKAKKQARLIKEVQKKKIKQLEAKKKNAEQRRRKKEEQLAKISDDYKVKGKVYKPRLAQPKKWCTTRLYKYLQDKMQPIHGFEARLKSEKLMLNMVDAVNFIMRTTKYDDYKSCLDKLKRMLARNGIVVTHDDFWLFAYDYLPYTFRIKAVPMTLPGNVETIPNWDPTKDDKPILDT